MKPATRSTPAACVFVYLAMVVCLIAAIVALMQRESTAGLLLVLNSIVLFIAAQVIGYLARTAEATEATRDHTARLVHDLGKARAIAQQQADAAEAKQIAAIVRLPVPRPGQRPQGPHVIKLD